VNGTVANRNLSTSATVEYPLSQQFDGASFALPESLEDKVEQFRQEVPESLPSNVSVLGTESSVYLVFSNSIPATGRANVTGVPLERTVNKRWLSFGAILASDVTFNTTGTPASVSAISDDPASYRLDLVRVDATHRQTGLLLDPDTGNQLTLPGTAGMLANDAEESSTLFTDIASKARALAVNGSVSQLTGTINRSIGRFLGEQTSDGLPTVSPRTAFWSGGANTTVDALVLTPGTAARTFASQFDPTNTSQRRWERPLLYRTERSLASKTVNTVSELRNQTESEGEVISVTANLTQQRISVQETAEHATDEECSKDKLTVETSEGFTCVNIPVDVLLHGGVAWTGSAPGTDDVIPIIGVSSRHEDSPNETLAGEYRIVGELVNASQVNESWRDRPVLVAYYLEQIEERERSRQRNQRTRHEQDPRTHGSSAGHYRERFQQGEWPSSTR